MKGPVRELRHGSATREMLAGYAIRRGSFCPWGSPGVTALAGPEFRPERSPQKTPGPSPGRTRIPTRRILRVCRSSTRRKSPTSVRLQPPCLLSALSLALQGVAGTQISGDSKHAMRRYPVTTIAQSHPTTMRRRSQTPIGAARDARLRRRFVGAPCTSVMLNEVKHLAHE